MVLPITFPDLILKTCVLIGLPLWHDWDAKINGVAFAPLYLGVDQVNGAALACVGFTDDVNGVQIGILGAAGNINGVIIAPFSFVGRGDCMQIALIAHNGIGRGSGRVLGQIHSDSGNIAPKQIIHDRPNIAPDRGDFRIKKRQKNFFSV